MSLANKTCWVVGGVGVIGRGITQGLLKAGATVIVNSRSTERLLQLSKALDHPDRLVTIHGSLLPGFASETVNQALSAVPLDHVVAHGAVRYWGSKKNNSFDETHSIMRPAGGLLQMSTDEFIVSSSHLAALHFSAAQELIPRIQFSNGCSSYTFVTGDGRGHPDGKRSAFGEINSRHVWGLSAAIRNEPLERVNCREICLRLAVNRSPEERITDPRERPLSEDIGTLCAGLAANADGKDDSGTLIDVSDQQILDSLMQQYDHEIEEEQSEQTGNA